eukprot:15393197-Alexandrium_andersonii.AAC.1
MSASLVGSEMCIRDSSRSPGSSGPPAAAPARWKRLPRNPPRPARGYSPVSYTHLTLPTICSV